MPNHNITGIDRNDLYESGGRILANTAKGIGIPLSDAESASWEDIMRRLANADEESESTQCRDLSAAAVIRILHLAQTADLLDAAESLLQANAAAKSSSDCPSHLDARAQEAVEAMRILRLTTADGQSDAHSTQWEQLTQCSVAGIYLDCLYDAREDANELPFGTLQLASNSLGRFIKTLGTIRPETYKSAIKAARQEKLGTYLAAKPMRALYRAIAAKKYSARTQVQ